MFTPALTIDDVIDQLGLIIDDCRRRNDPLGFFPLLYLQVTKQVKLGIATGFFADGPRMERLDVLFAQRYLDAYQLHRNEGNPTQSWQAAFALGSESWPIVLQHLLVGINAHINLDLGIAAAIVSKGEPIDDLRGDFYKINEILADLVNNVEEDLSAIWPRLSKIIQWMGGAENLLMDFSMEIARNGAWEFAKKMHAAPQTEHADLVRLRDLQVTKTAKIVSGNGWFVRMLFQIIRWGERGTVAEKMDHFVD